MMSVKETGVDLRCIVTCAYKKEFSITARKKNTAWKKHRTGNPRSVAYFNEENLRVLQIVGETPAYKGIRPDKDDTPIQISSKNKMASATNAKQCNAELIEETPAITQAANIGHYFLP